MCTPAGVVSVSQHDMPIEDCEYEPTALWCADLLLRGNQLVGTSSLHPWSSEQTAQGLGYNRLLGAMAAGVDGLDAGSTRKALRPAIFTMSLLRREVATTLRLAQTPSDDPKDAALGYAAFDWLSVAADRPPVQSLDDVRPTVDYGMQRLRVILADAATLYMDVTPSERARTLGGFMTSPAVARLVRGALTMQVVVDLFDSARLAVGLRLANHAFGNGVVPMGSELNRAEQARADAYMTMRLYAALETVVAVMMMGVAKRAETVGDRSAWPQTPGGKAVLAFRSEVGATLRAYDEAKRAPSVAAGKTYTAQTAGYVSALQEQAAVFAIRLQDPDSALYDALVCGLGTANLFHFSHDTPTVSSDMKHTFWDAVGVLGRLVENAGSGVVPVQTTVSMTCSMLLLGALADEPAYMLRHSRAMRTAMSTASKSWPSVEAFYGRDYKDTDRKVTAKAQREGRDPFGREVGETLGYRLEWMGYLANGPPPRVVPSSSADLDAHQAAAVSTMAQVEVHGRLCPVRAMPMASGNAIHQVHGVAVAMDPGMLGYAHRAGEGEGEGEQPHLFEVGDERYQAAVAQLDQADQADHLQRKQLFVERVVERVAPLYRAWSGAVLATECFHEFFAEVWKRFNNNMRHEGSPWADKLERWLEHYANDTTPPRANGEAKLIHPWRLMHLQKSVARSLLAERYGETALSQHPDPSTRVSMRYQRALLSGLVDVYDYAPWASHIIRRFCSMEEHRAAKRRREEHRMASQGLQAPDPMPVDPPARPRARPRPSARCDSPSLNRPPPCRATGQ